MDANNQGPAREKDSFWRRKGARRRKDAPSAGEPDGFFQAINRWGETIRCEVMLSFEADGQNYLIYTNNTYTLLGRLNLYATRYNPETFGKGRPLFLRDPDSEAEWQLIRKMAHALIDDF